MNVAQLFAGIRQELLDTCLPKQQAVYVHMDDTTIRKRGRKVAGTSWMRDPLGPPFHTNFMWGQRFIQLSVSLPEQKGASRSRAIPVDFHHCRPVKKPKKNDDAVAWAHYKEQQKKNKLSQVGSDRLHLLREQLNQQGAKDRHLIISVDGSYTNQTVIRHLPNNTTLIGRVRKDCRLYTVPDSSAKRPGRKRVYGNRFPTPEQILRSTEYKWHKVEAWAAGRVHSFDLKVVRNIRWQKAGEKNLQLVVIRPLAYRLTKHSRMLYRQPAYLLCTDPDLELRELLQAYLWRWEIEVNFRDEKTVFGCGEAQVRKQGAVQKLPAFVVAVYAFLLLAAHTSMHDDGNQYLPRPKWYNRRPRQRLTTGDIINTARSQIWSCNAHINFSDFVNLLQDMKSRKYSIQPTISAALFSRL